MRFEVVGWIGEWDIGKRVVGSDRKGETKSVVGYGERECKA
jgi:hypothetical protein